MTGVFETQTFQVCPTEPIISVKEFAYGSPKFFATQKTFLNANIQRLHPNFLAHSQVRRNSQ